jgi:uncharacterized protein (TIGR00369 family)
VPLELQPTVERIPAVRDLGLRMEKTEDGLTFTATTGPQHANDDGSPVTHGGVVGAILDTAATLAAVVHGEQLWATVNMNVTYLRATPIGPVSGEAVTVHRGRTQALVRSGLRDEKGRLVAEAAVVLAAIPGTS